MANTKKSNDEKDTKKKTTKKVEKETEKKSTAKKSTKNSSTKKAEKKQAPKKVEKIVEESKEEVEQVTEETTNNKKIKIIFVIIGLVIFFAVIFAISNSTGKGEYSDAPTTSNSRSVQTSDVSQESASISEDEMSDLTSIDIKQYLALKKSNDNYSIIYIGRPTCSHCQVQLPIMKHMVYKYGVTVNYLNTDDLDEDGISKLQASDDYFSEGWGTPLILIVKNDEIVTKSEGETSIEDLVTMFKKYNLIKEEE